MPLSTRAPSRAVATKKVPPPDFEEAALDLRQNRQAAAEAAQFASGKSKEELEREAAELEHGRRQKFKNHFEIIAISGMYVFALTLVAIGLTWLYHLLAPDSWHWLKPDGVSKVQNIFTGGILAGVVADHFRKRVG